MKPWRVQTAAERIATARAELVIAAPFWAALALRLRPVASSSVDTCATDGESLFYSAPWVESLTLAQLVGTLAHEAAHCALAHFARRGSRDLAQWNEACDLAVNPALLQSGLTLPPGILVDWSLANESAETIYKRRAKPAPAPAEPSGEGDDSDGSDDAEPSGDDAERGDDSDDAEPGEGDDSDDGAQDGAEPGEGASPSGDDGSAEPGEGSAGEGRGDAQDGTGEGSAPGGATGAPSGSPAQDGSAGAQDGTGDAQDGSAGAEPGEGLDAPGEGLDGTAPGAKRHGREITGIGGILDAPADAERDLATEWRIAVAQAVSAAKAAGNLPAFAERIARERASPQVDWRTMLRDFVSSATEWRATWTRPNRRHVWTGLHLPGKAPDAVPCVVVGVDTSGSIGAAELAAFGAEVAAILDDGSVDRAEVAYCDTRVAHAETFERGDAVRLTMRGGGGTAFAPVFAWQAEHAPDAACVIYLTDLCGSDFGAEPACPVLWICTVPEPYATRPPFGTVAYLDVNAG